MSTPFDTLGLPDTAEPSEIRTRYRELANKFHPDKQVVTDYGVNEGVKVTDEGGIAKWHAIQNAYERAMVIASEPKPCARCRGLSKVTVVRGFSSIELACPDCSTVKKEKQP